MIPIIFIILGLVAAYFIFKTFKKARVYWKLPGPYLNISDLVRLYFGPIEGFMDRLSQMMGTYNGEVACWLGPALSFFTSNPDHVQQILASTNYDHGNIYEFFKSVMGEGVFTANGEKWKNTRIIYYKSFPTSSLSEVFQKTEKHAQVFVDVLREKVGKPEFNVERAVQSLTLDWSFDVLLRYDISTFQRARPPVADAIEIIRNLVFSRMYKIWQHNEWLFHKLPTGRKLAKEYKKVELFLDDVIKHVTKNKEELENKHFLNYILEDKTRDAKDVRDEIATLVLAGADTTTVTIGFLLMMLGAEPHVQDKVLEEDRVIMDSLNGRDLELSDLEKYNYLERVIKETLRIFPVGPVIARRLKEDTQLGKHFLPAGMQIVISVYTMERNPAIYENPLEFNPDRFLPSVERKRHPYAFIPFSGGGRNCLGPKMAWVILKLTILHVVRRYKIHCNYKAKDVQIQLLGLIKSVHGFPISIEERTK